MGDSKFSKTFKKQIGRSKEKFMESLGKADRTKDELFEQHNKNFELQQASAERLRKQLHNYVTCVRGMAQANKGLHETLRDLYEPGWPGTEHVQAMSQSIELLWDDFHEKLVDQALNPLLSYHSQFGEVGKKIQKRGRKLVDYDGARHTVDTLSAGAKKDEAKQQKAQEQFSIAQKLYNDLNNELMDELPALYDSRITFYVNNFQTLCNLEQTFHSETAKLNRDLSKVMDQLGQSAERLRVPRHSLTGDTPTKNSGPPPPRPQPITKTPSQHSPKTPTKTAPDSPKTIHIEANDSSTKELALYPNVPDEPADVRVEEVISTPFDDSEGSSAERRVSRDSEDAIVEEPTVHVQMNGKEEAKPKVSEEKPSPKEEENAPDSPKPPETPVKERANFLYKVRATHRYTAEDDDELALEAGEVIDVLKNDDPEELDEGWLLGIKETTGEKGVFPANFTKQL